jgi:hypothetical protein
LRCRTDLEVAQLFVPGAVGQGKTGNGLILKLKSLEVWREVFLEKQSRRRMTRKDLLVVLGIRLEKVEWSSHQKPDEKTAVP